MAKKALFGSIITLANFCFLLCMFLCSCADLAVKTFTMSNFQVQTLLEAPFIALGDR